MRRQTSTTRYPEADETRLDEEIRLDEILSKCVPQDTPGVALLVMRGDTPVLAREYGNGRIRDLKSDIRKRKTTKHTVFDLGSLSKQFTALAIIMLIDRTTRRGPDRGKYKRRLSFNSRLSTFFRDLPGADEIKIRHLLNHSSGLPDYLSLKVGGKRKFDGYYDHALNATGYWYATMKKKRNWMTNQDVIDLIAQQKKLRFKPGTEFEYSDTGYVVLAEIVRRITGKRLGQFLKGEVFDRLRMNDTFVYDDTCEGFARHALCYRRSRVTYKSIKSDTVFNCIYGDGNVHSTIGDLVKWLRAWNRIDDCRDSGVRNLIKRNTLVKLFKPHLIKDKRKFKYSAGFFVYRYRNNKVNSYAMYHGGDWLGFHSYLMRAHVYLKSDPIPKQTSILVLSNYIVLSKYDGADPFAIAKDLALVYWDKNLPQKYNVLKHVE